MKRILTALITAAFLLPNALGAQEEGPPEKGSYKTYYSSGALKSRENYRNSQLHGTAKYYYENGKLAVETKYKNGKAHGLEKSYYPDGTIRREATFENGVMEGTLKLYDNEGNLTSEFNVINGKREGLAKAFRSDKSVREECEFKDDTQQMCSYFDKQGLLKARSQLDPNNPDRTIYLTYDEDGKVAEAVQGSTPTADN